MNCFQELRGTSGLIIVPGAQVGLSLKKQARWKWVEERTVDPEWFIRSGSGADSECCLSDQCIWVEKYDVDGNGIYPSDLCSPRLRPNLCDKPDLEAAHEQEEDVMVAPREKTVIVNRMGRSVHTPPISRTGRQLPCPVTESVVVDDRHYAYAASRCCGCYMCSRGSPRWKAMKKTKGRRKHSGGCPDWSVSL